MRIIRTIVILVLAGLSAACAPGLGGKLQVRDLSDESHSRASLEISAMRVSVQPFGDGRQDSAIGSYDGQDLEPDGNIGAVVQSALESKLRARGATIALFDTPHIEGQVKEWFVNVRPGFPTSEVQANVALELQLFDPQGKLLYRSNYAGEAAEKNPIFSQSRIEQVLWLALNEALNEVVADRELLGKLEFDRIR